MENFLSEQKRGASDLGSGSFTLNRERALELAKTLQLPEKRAYVLKLVQWAVASGASHIKVDTRKDSLSFQHNGAPPNDKELQDLKMGVVDFAHLSTGIYGALGLEPSSLSLAWEGGGFDFVTGATVDYAGESGYVAIQIEGISKGLFERSSLVSRFLKGNWNRISINGALQRLILDAAGFTSIESALVRNFCGLCFVPIELNGKLVNSAFEPVSGSYHTSWEHGVLKLKSKSSKLQFAVFLNFCYSDKPGEVIAPLHPLANSDSVKIRNQWFKYPTTSPVTSSELSRDQEFRTSVTLDGLPMYRALGLHRPMAGTSALNVILVKDGVVVDDYQEKGEGLSGLAYFSATGLRTSADGFRVVRDETFEEYRSNLRALFVENQVDSNDYQKLLGS